MTIILHKGIKNACNVLQFNWGEFTLHSPLHHGNWSYSMAWDRQSVQCGSSYSIHTWQGIHLFLQYCSWHICVPWSKAPHRSLAGRWRPFVSRDLSVACRQKRQAVQIPIDDMSLREIEKQGTFTIGIQFSQDGSPRTLPPLSAGRYYKQRLRRVKLWL